MNHQRERNGIKRPVPTGARLIPLDTLTPELVTSGRRDPTQPILLICHSGGRAAKACERLQAAGIGPVYSIKGGTSAWAAANMPVFRGTATVISLERQVRIGAGVLVLAGSTLTWLVHPAFIGLPAFVGAGFLIAGLTDFCGMGILLAKMPWNR